jgi:hypothetical protein
VSHWHRRPTLFLILLVLPSLSSLARADAVVGSAPPHTVAVGPRYGAGSVRRWLWGNGYRDLYTTRVTLPVLNLRTFASGLTPIARVGAGETGALALKGNDGHDYTFRPVVKESKELVPVDLHETLTRRLLIDQMPAAHPAGPVVAAGLLEAAGVLHNTPRLVVMPDDPLLGEFRPAFADVVGQIEEWSGSSGFAGSTETIDGAEMWRRLRKGPEVRPDAAAYLRARLVDQLMGDWDRHRGQWRWARLPGEALWQPIPEDRDQAFSRFEGVFNAFMRPRLPLLVKFGSEYSSLDGLTYDGWDVDKRILAGLAWPEWESVARELQAALTDASIEAAAQRLPSEYVALDGNRLTSALEARRDGLVQQARRFYTYINREVDVFCTDVSERVEVRRFENGDLAMSVGTPIAPGDAKIEPYLRRRFEKSVTREVRVYLRGGDDRVVVTGGARREGVLLRVVAGDGTDVLDDSRGGGTRFSGSSPDDQVIAGPGTHWDRRPYAPPPPNPRADWMPPRDWGRTRVLVPRLTYGSDYGLLAGASLERTGYGFRCDPWSSQQSLRLLYSTANAGVRGTYIGQFRFENSPFRLGMAALGSGIEVSRFFGLGNETIFSGNEKVYRIEQDRVAIETALVWAAGPRTDLSLGVLAKHNITEPLDDPVFEDETYYGVGKLAQLGLSTHFRFDGTDRLGLPRGGLFVTAGGTAYPALGKISEPFGDIRGQVLAYLSTPNEKSITLVLKAGGQRVFGTHPFFESAFIGGKTPLSLLEPGGGSSVRGLPPQRYAGDASLYGGADLYLPLTKSLPLVPGQFGLVGFYDIGRVFLDGEVSRRWHHGIGGGVFLTTPGRRHLVSFVVARSEGNIAFYVRAGLGL